MRLRFIVLVIGVLLLSGCVGSGFLGDSGQGTLAVFLTDAPTNDIKHVYVTISEVAAHSEENSWQTVTEFVEGLEVDLLALRFDEQLLGEEMLPVGNYTQLRLIITDGRIIMDDDSQEPFRVPSGEQSGIKIHHNFAISDGVVTELVMDVDLLDFIKEDANGYRMQPTAIRVVDRVISGTVEGWVGIGDATTPAPVVDQDVFVELFDGETKVAGTVALKVNQDGRVAGDYRLNAVIAGNYRLEAYTLAPDGVTRLSEGVIDEVIVSPNTVTTVAPIFLQEIDNAEVI